MFLFYSVYLMTLTKNNAHAAACIAAEIYSARHAPTDILPSPMRYFTGCLQHSEVIKNCLFWR